MALSVMDLFKIGVGPSSSHTVGPMNAARGFAQRLQRQGVLDTTASLTCELFGSLGATGRGHGTVKAVVVGLMGHRPETVDPEAVEPAVRQVQETLRLDILGRRNIHFVIERDVLLKGSESLPHHSNALRFTARDLKGNVLEQRDYFSIGGGFVLDESEITQGKMVPDAREIPYPFSTGAELVALCNETGLPISQIMLANEGAWRPEAATREQLLQIWAVMQECVAKGCTTFGILPGGLSVKRRAPMMRRRLETRTSKDALDAMDWVTLYALAVNEQNAAGGRIVTAPTNGAAGVIPAVLHYYRDFVPHFDEAGAVRFLLAAGAIGIIIKEGASISGAEVGCQGEVGSACSMAAAGIAEVLGGTPEQVENAAEIALEHNLGLTCDPIGGLVQVPCIERNAVAAVKAITASRIARFGDGSHLVSLDKVVKTMLDTGRDMQSKYKETALGGLAVSVIEC